MQQIPPSGSDLQFSLLNSQFSISGEPDIPTPGEPTGPTVPEPAPQPPDVPNPYPVTDPQPPENPDPYPVTDPPLKPDDVPPRIF